MLAARTAPVSASRSFSFAPARPAQLRAKPRAAALPEVVSGLAAAGDVDAPIGVVIGGAIVVTLIATAIVPLALKPGQEASDRIFEAKQKAPLDNKTGPGKPKKSRR